MSRSGVALSTGPFDEVKISDRKRRWRQAKRSGRRCNPRPALKFLWLPESARRGGTIFREGDMPRANFGDLLAAESMGQKLLPTRYGNYDLAAVLKTVAGDSKRGHA